MTTQQDAGCTCHHEERELSRRSFLKRMGAVGAGVGLASEGLATRLAFAEGAYHGDVIVVLSLRGGIDGLNAIVPTTEPRYYSERPHIGIPQAKLIQLDNNFGMHPALDPLHKYWKNGTFGVIHAVGMQTPTRSHFAAMGEMERAAPGSSVRTGWLDRTLGLRASSGSYRGTMIGANRPPAAFSGATPELSIYSVDSFTLAQVDNRAERTRWRTALLGMNQDAPTALAAPAKLAVQAVNAAASLQRDGYRPREAASYPNTELGKAMKDVARLIKADVGLQVACVDFGEWDMHSGMGTVGSGWLRSHLSELARTLDAFATDLGTTMKRVTLVTLSEFGRRLKENGSGGTDHGHGQAIFLLGGGVRGGKVHGQWPGLGVNDLVDGDLAGTTDYRNVLAELLEKRCGAGSISTIFPGITSDRVGAFKART
ncbi:MAG TPA: DUF1501 domain-containing protein [Actinomycetes bacterium]|nr:DUF1501 domain-containing protein [Actinomycetes bacterium]